MLSARKLKFNPYFVRSEFRRKVCGELMLPSGKPSGYFLHPVEDGFVQDVADMYEAPDAKVITACGAENVHEWLLWTAARLKYGVNYLAPKRNQFWLKSDAYGKVKEQQNKFEEELIKLDNIVEQRMEWLSETLAERGEEEKSKKIKNILRERLTSENVEL